MLKTSDVAVSIALPLMPLSEYEMTVQHRYLHVGKVRYLPKILRTSG